MTCADLHSASSTVALALFLPKPAVSALRPLTTPNEQPSYSPFPESPCAASLPKPMIQILAPIGQNQNLRS
ncbi:hypothetical protein F5Y08DRAFT_324904 [Xylaria arbuscula]|nr:hypothetical protein F5Y08DRAFT_324904 [Xylaria arbuscula]